MKNKKGFTLIELLVVIAIIGLLSTLAVVSLNSARSKARDARRTSDIRQIQTALEMYFNDVSAYPIRATSVLPLGKTGALTLSLTNGWSDTVSGTPYMNSVPTDPIAASSYDYGVTTGSTYSIDFTLENVKSEWGPNTDCTATPGSISCPAAP
jgi:type II secretion system protein G